MNTIEDNTSNVALFDSEDNGQRRDEAVTRTQSKTLCSRCYEQRQGEAPTGIQPKATPWVWM
ncbi:hypothetical protein [Hoylesella timonensis]|uniref:hypothetical protein n=1 Tax=Hoylesella timonensis TaxID=386414 RepID=UPI0002E8BA19|nr:hypothetical protein [Hoylesella timonensis]